MTTLWLIVLCGVLAIIYAIWATSSVLRADAGSAKMQEIAAAIREGAQAYLRRQYTTIAVVGVVMFIIVGIFLGWLVAVGFAVGAILFGRRRLYWHEHIGASQCAHRAGRHYLARRRS